MYDALKPQIDTFSKHILQEATAEKTKGDHVIWCFPFCTWRTEGLTATLHSANRLCAPKSNYSSVVVCKWSFFCPVSLLGNVRRLNTNWYCDIKEVSFQMRLKRKVRVSSITASADTSTRKLWSLKVMSANEMALETQFASSALKNGSSAAGGNKRAVFFI